MNSEISGTSPPNEVQEYVEPIVVTRASPYIHYPHRALSAVVEQTVGVTGPYRLVTAHAFPGDLLGLANLAHLVERTMVPQKRQSVVVADWDGVALARTAKFLKEWPSLRNRATVAEVKVPRRNRNPRLPMVLIDGQYGWAAGPRLIKLIERYFGVERYHLMALPGGPLGIGSQSPKFSYLLSQLQSALRDKELESLIMLSSIERSVIEDDDSSARWHAVSDLKRAYGNVRQKIPELKVLAGAAIVEDGQLVGLDNTLLASR